MEHLLPAFNALLRAQMLEFRLTNNSDELLCKSKLTSDLTA